MRAFQTVTGIGNEARFTAATIISFIETPSTLHRDNNSDFYHFCR